MGIFRTEHFAIRYRTKEPNYSHLQVQEHDCSRTVYRNVKEEIPKDIPELHRINYMTVMQENQSQQCYTSSNMAQGL